MDGPTTKEGPILDELFDSANPNPFFGLSKTRTSPITLRIPTIWSVGEVAFGELARQEFEDAGRTSRRNACSNITGLLTGRCDPLVHVARWLVRLVKIPPYYMPYVGLLAGRDESETECRQYKLMKIFIERIRS
jgi:hypothetical protein